jgi:hypothetical protein
VGLPSQQPASTLTMPNRRVSVGWACVSFGPTSVGSSSGSRRLLDRLIYLRAIHLLRCRPLVRPAGWASMHRGNTWGSSEISGQSRAAMSRDR